MKKDTLLLLGLGVVYGIYVYWRYKYLLVQYNDCGEIRTIITELEKVLEDKK